MSSVEYPPPPPPVQEETPGAPREIGPQRFQRRTAPDHEERSLLRAWVAGLTLAFLVVGVPMVLLTLAGPPPVPTSWPTRDDLTATIGADQLIGVLLWVVWLAWLQFTACVLVELRSAVRGVGLPARVPMAGASQRLARVLVGSVLLAATAVGQASAAVPASTADAPTAGRTVSSLSATADGTASATVERTEQQSESRPAQEAQSGEVTYRLGDLVLDEDEGKELLGRKIYIVQPPDGRYHDNLWDIAERTLGDGRRYKEIFELNQGRTQPDGHELSLARLIYPNWLLIVPDDATGVDTVTVEETEPPAEEAPPSGQGQGSGGASGETDETSGAEGEGAADAGGGRSEAGADEEGGRELTGGSRQAPDSDAAGSEQSPYHDLAYAGLLAAGVFAAIEMVRRRRRTPEPNDDEVEAEVALRVGADPDRARWLDYALRSLSASCRENGQALPAVYAAFVDNSVVELVLAPGRTDAPYPWTASEDGRQWTLRREVVVGAEPVPADVLAPYPGLVSMGRDGDRDVLVDLEAAGGPICVSGDPAVAFEVVTAIAVELATNYWSDHLRVTAEGLPDELSVLDPARLRLVDDVTTVLPEIAANRVDSLGPDVLSGRLRPGGAGAWMPEYVVLGTAPDADLSARLMELTSSSSRSPLGVVCAGEVTGARWRLSVDSAGTLELPALGLSVRANQLSWRSVEAIAGLVEPGWADGGDGPDDPVMHEAWLPEVRPAVPEPPKVVDVAHLATAPVRVFVLGPVEVQAANEIDDERRALATEIVVHLALHPEGVHPTVLAAAVWPRGVTAAVREATFARVRDWLGVDPNGSPYLLMTADGKLTLGADVVLDWNVVCAILRRSREVRTREEEITLLRQALRVARGPVLAERPLGRYAWIARARLERVASDVLVDAAHRLSVLSGDGGDPATAAAAARAGLRVQPREQILWRDLLQAQHAAEGTAAVARVADEMSATLTELGVGDIEPETGALLDELLPSSSAHRPGSHRRDLA